MDLFLLGDVVTADGCQWQPGNRYCQSCIHLVSHEDCTMYQVLQKLDF